MGFADRTWRSELIIVEGEVDGKMSLGYCTVAIGLLVELLIVYHESQGVSGIT
jgi:hypothetical protein